MTFKSVQLVATEVLIQNTIGLNTRETVRLQQLHTDTQTHSCEYFIFGVM